MSHSQNSVPERTRYHSGLIRDRVTLLFGSPRERRTVGPEYSCNLREVVMM
jgi:hypothetical protein